MHNSDCGDTAATRQSRRGSAVFEHAFEHGFRPARYSEFVGEDYDRRGGSIYADRVDAGSAGVHRIAIGVAINPGRASSEPKSDAGSGTTSANARIGARDITGRASSFTCG